MPGSFNYPSAAAILNALFVNPKSAGSTVANMRMYCSTGSVAWGSGPGYTAAFSYGSGSTTAGTAIPLYLGLIMGVSTTPPTSADSFFDATTPGAAWASGYGEPRTGTTYGYAAYRRQVVVFEGTTNSGSSPALPQAVSSSSQVSFPILDASGITSGLVALGFFITTEASAGSIPGGFPAAGTIVAAGTFASARALAASDQPIFVGNAITISLD